MIQVNYSALKYLKKENIFNFTSNKEGLNVAVLAGVHGDEKSGIIAIKNIVKNFTIKLNCYPFHYLIQELLYLLFVIKKQLMKIKDILMKI